MAVTLGRHSRQGLQIETPNEDSLEPLIGVVGVEARPPAGRMGPVYRKLLQVADDRLDVAELAEHVVGVEHLADVGADRLAQFVCTREPPVYRAVTKIAHDHISGKPEITDGLLNHIEVGIRAYDPCLSCATHALGQMPLAVSLIDAEGNEIDRRVR